MDLRDAIVAVIERGLKVEWPSGAYAYRHSEGCYVFQTAYKSTSVYDTALEAADAFLAEV